MSKEKSKKNRIFIGPSEASGYYYNLYMGLKELGEDVSFIKLGSSKHGYKEGKVDAKIVRGCQFANMKWRNAKDNSKKITYLFWKGVFIALLPFVFVWTLFNFDVFIFSGSRSFFNYYELPLLKLLRKKTIKLSLGSLTRPAFIDGTVIYGSYVGTAPTINKLIKITKKQKRLVSRIDKYSYAILDHPPQALFHERKFVSLTNIGIPYDVQSKPVLTSESNDTKKVRILHAPSYRSHKGTDSIRKVIEELTAEGKDIDYVEFSNVENHVILDEISKCDLVIDEMYSDAPMATLVVEAASLGKPTVVGGYFADYLDQHYKPNEIPPSVFVKPEKLKSALETLIEDKYLRQSIGLQAKDFVNKEMDRKVVAQKILAVINGVAPEEWYLDPYELDYIYGYGLSKEKIKSIVMEMVKVGGMKALQLYDKPKLEEIFIKFMNE